MTARQNGKSGKPKLAVWTFTSCDGCQLGLLDSEDELLAVFGAVEIAYFPKASRAELKGPYDISLVEGSISTPDDIERIRKIRRQSKLLIAIGACATAGGIQAVKNFRDIRGLLDAVYARADFSDLLAAPTAIRNHAPVDGELRGCPINKYQLLEALNALLNGRRPNISTASECIECKRAGNVCVMVAKGTPCMGPVVQTGCGALCPSHDRGCYGCFGPKEMPNTASLAARMAELGMSKPDIGLAFRSFNANAEPFRKEGDRHDRR